MDIKPTKEKKKKRVSKKRADEIHRRRESVLPSDVPLPTQSASGSWQESGTELCNIEVLNEAEKDNEDNSKRGEKMLHHQNEDGTNVEMEDFWYAE